MVTVFSGVYHISYLEMKRIISLSLLLERFISLNQTKFSPFLMSVNEEQ